MIRDRAALVGFEMNLKDDSRIWNTFDAHRLIHWAGAEPGAGGPDGGGPEAQARMKRALLEAHFTHNQPLNEAETLVAAAEAAGLDGAEAQVVLARAGLPTPCAPKKSFGSAGASTRCPPWWSRTNG